MSTQSIYIKNLNYYQYEFENRLLKSVDDLKIYNRFMIGEKPNKDKIFFIKMFNKILCADNCELINFIGDKIKNKTPDCEKNNLRISDVFKEYQKNRKHCGIPDIIEECVGEIQW